MKLETPLLSQELYAETATGRSLDALFCCRSLFVGALWRARPR